MWEGDDEMNLNQIDRLVGTVPEGIEQKSRRRLDGYAAVARRCESRITALRGDLERALRSAGDVAHDGGDLDAASDAALALLCELDALERVQPRIDAWLRVSVGALSDEVQMGPVGEGPI
jgi:ABC-type transporter Mla subunit MlaD